MELNELYGIIGNAIIIIMEIIVIYCSIKLAKKILYLIYNDNAELNKLMEESYKKNHFKKHFKKWIKNKELQKKYNDFYEYYEPIYNKQNMYSETYKDFIKYKENKEK